MRFRTPHDAHELVGREPQVRRLDRLLAGAKTGHGGALVVTGEPGIGKTALLDHLIAQDSDVTVLATTGVESEVSLSFAGLGDLLRPLLPRLPTLPEAQENALSAALALVEHPGRISPYAVCMATLTLLTDHAERRPVVIVVDDANWIDQPSTTALVFAARRLQVDAMAIVLAVRDTAVHDLDVAGLDIDRIRGLDRGAASFLLDRLRPGSTAAAVADELWRATGGNPLALTKVCAGLSDDQLAGSVPLPGDLPVGRDLQTAFVGGLMPLPAKTRRALLVVALSASEEQAAVAVALNELGLDLAALDLAAAQGVIEYRGARVVFTQPLMRAAVRGAASARRRRRVYAALAATSTTEARAWYRAAELVGYNESAAKELEWAAGQMRRRTGFAAAAQAMHRAAELTSDRDARARRLLTAAGDAQLCGWLPEAAGWLGQARMLADDARLRADLALTHGRVLNRRGTPSIALQVLASAAEEIAGQDPLRAAQIWCDAVNTAFIDGRAREAVEYASNAVDLLAGVGDAGGLAAARTVLGQALLVRGRVAESRRLLGEQRSYVDGLDPIADADKLAMVALCWAWLEEYATAGALLRTVIDATRRTGALGPLSRALAFHCETCRSTGDWLTGYVEAEEALRLSRELRDVATVGYALVCLARFEAPQGRVALADERLAEARRIAGPLGAGGLRVMQGSALGLRYLAAGERERAIMSLEEVREFAVSSGVETPVIAPWEADLVDAYWQDGRRAQATAQLDMLDMRTRSSGLVAPRAAVARYRALLSDDFDRSEHHFREALALHALRPQPFERARTAMYFGEMLRRNRHRADARPLLREAVEGFRRLGAEPFARRAAAELAATGDRREPRSVSPMGRLTARELQVAQAVTTGLSNPEVAAALFVSTKTVETHLSSAYRKLGLRSRTQLARYLADREAQSRGDGSGSAAAVVGSA
ncbi:AAA family ATPase [Actinoplanes sp. NPDC051633]|uniref:helix-turn-helix transcriptional regulator n=1 Tax=Actinoplanes sp. NPDC051633 TaxID=3155670 RepID=UPI00344202E3